MKDSLEVIYHNTAEESPVARDEKLYSLLAPFLFEEYSLLVPTSRARQRAEFLSGSILEPHFTYKRLRAFNISALRAGVSEISNRIENHADPLVRDVYRAKVNEVDIKLNLLEASQSGDDEAFFFATKKYYGEPKEDIFQHTLRSVLRKCELVAGAEKNASIQRSTTWFSALLRSLKKSEAISYSSHLFVPPVKDDDTILSAQRIAEKCREALGILNIYDWEVIISGPGDPTIFDTKQDEKRIYVPRNRDLITRKNKMTERRANALIAHEIGTHIARRSNGERSTLKLLGRGLAGYLRGEEGIATYQEQAWLGSHDYAGEERYLALSLACGIDGMPRSFRELWEIMHAYSIVKMRYDTITNAGEYDAEKILSIAPTQAWLHCLRTFRGTTGGTRGRVYTKDVVYREGNMAIWKLLEKDPSWEKRFTLGKYDPTNESHRHVLQKLEIV